MKKFYFLCCFLFIVVFVGCEFYGGGSKVQIGDIVLSDGRVVPVEHYSFWKRKYEPVGVVVGVSGNNAMMMGLYKSSNSGIVNNSAVLKHLKFILCSGF